MNKSKIGYVYLIISPSNKKYVGSTKDIDKRKYYYNRLLCKNQIKLLNSFRKHGVENHTIMVIWSGDIMDILKMENKLGIEHDVLNKDTGLNLKLPKIYENIKCFSEETLNKMSVSQKKRLRRKFTNEEKLKMSIVKRGKVFPQSQRDKMAKSKFKIVICTKTGTKFESVKSAALFYGINKTYLAQMLRGVVNNHTTLKYKSVVNIDMPAKTLLVSDWLFIFNLQVVSK